MFASMFIETKIGSLRMATPGTDFHRVQNKKHRHNISPINKTEIHMRFGKCQNYGPDETKTVLLNKLAGRLRI